MGWLKEKYKEKLLSGVITLILFMLMAWITKFGNDKEEVNNKLQDLEVNKATYQYVDKKDEEIKKELDKTENLFLEEIRQLRIDLRLKQDKK